MHRSLLLLFLRQHSSSSYSLSSSRERERERERGVAIRSISWNHILCLESAVVFVNRQILENATHRTFFYDDEVRMVLWYDMLCVKSRVSPVPVLDSCAPFSDTRMNDVAHETSLPLKLRPENNAHIRIVQHMVPNAIYWIFIKYRKSLTKTLVA